jgi:fucose 4-O-acetylase-like acetyltransferase
MGKLIFTGIKKVGQLQIKRILWIDATKVIGIWLVVLGHMNLPEYVVSPIFSFHMALFFFISGFLEKSDKITNTIIKGFRGLIIPYIFFYFISYFWWFNVSLSRHQEIYGNISIGSAIFKPLFGMLFGVGYCTKYSTMINVPLWFLVGLFAVKLIHHFILQICNNNIKKYLLLNIPIILVVYILKKNNIDLLFSLDSALLAFPFFGLGYFSQTTKKDFLNQFIDYKNNTILKISIIIVVFILLLTLSKYNGRVDINEFKYGKNIFVFYSNGFLGTILIICLSSFYRKKKLSFRNIGFHCKILPPGQNQQVYSRQRIHARDKKMDHEYRLMTTADFVPALCFSSWHMQALKEIGCVFKKIQKHGVL